MRAATDIIDSIINFAMIQVVGSSPNTNILFHPSKHQQFFSILLLDFLSTTDKRLIGQQVSYLEALQTVTRQSSFDSRGSISSFRGAVASLSKWLAVEPTVKAWMPSIDHELDPTMPRISFLGMGGNISKHSVPRQAGPAKELQELLQRSDIQQTLASAALALMGSYENFHTDILNYHASKLSEMLNDIQWGIYKYLLPEYRRSYTYEGGEFRKYHFCYPEGVESALARSLCWDYMNWVRRKPIVERFEVTRFLAMRY